MIKLHAICVHAGNRANETGAIRCQAVGDIFLGDHSLIINDGLIEAINECDGRLINVEGNLAGSGMIRRKIHR